MTKQRACILGATGAAGQNIVESLAGHPWFQIDALAASSRSAGKRYGDAIEGAIFFEKTPEDKVLDMTVLNVEEIDPRDYDLAFSALPSGVAKGFEAKFAEHIPVFSTASAYRYEDDVPVLIPDVNPDHIALIDTQRRNRGWKGYIVPGPNCTTVGLVATLKPIMDAFGVKKVRMISMQSLSGAGEKGLRADSPYRAKVEMNVYPYIEGEEEKVVLETNKILGSIVDGERCPRHMHQGLRGEGAHRGGRRRDEKACNPRAGQSGPGDVRSGAPETRTPVDTGEVHTGFRRGGHAPAQAPQGAGIHGDSGGEAPRGPP
jgi:aspartate-semialdehyde dehydrogenase